MTGGAIAQRLGQRRAVDLADQHDVVLLLGEALDRHVGDGEQIIKNKTKVLV